MDTAEMIREAFANEHALEGAAFAAMPGPAVNADDRLYNAAAPMADGGDTRMTAAEEVLAWLLVEKIGAPDDVSYSPDQAQQIIVNRLESISALTPAPDRTSENERLRKALESAGKALLPMADAVFNDNGDMTVQMPTPTYDECISAYFAEKRITAALERT